MTPLMPHQQELLEHLEQEPRQRAILLSAPPGAGLSAVVARFIASFTLRSDPVVVITDRRMLIDQWAYRLTQAEADHVVALATSSDVLMELDRTESVIDRSSIFIVTIQLLSQGAGRKLADALRPGVLVIDRIPGLGVGPRRQLIEGLASRSESVLVLTDTGRPEWFQPTESIAWTMRDMLLRGLPSIEILSYQPSDRENALYSRALELLRDATGNVVLYPRTRPAVHASMLRLIARLSGDRLYGLDDDDEAATGGTEVQVRSDVRSTVLQEVWAVIDSLEELGEDGRLEATHSLVQRAAQEDRLCVVTTELVVEAGYVAAYLEDHNIPVFLVTVETTPVHWRQLEEALSERSVVIATSAAFDLISNIPQRTQIVWWSSPRTVSKFRRWLTLAARTPQSKVTAITTQPWPGEQDLQAMFNSLDKE